MMLEVMCSTKYNFYSHCADF